MKARTLLSLLSITSLSLSSCAGLTERPAPRTTTVTVTRGQEPPNATADTTPDSSKQGHALPTATAASGAGAGTSEAGGAGKVRSQGATLPVHPQLDGTARIVDASNFSYGSNEWLLTDPTGTIVCLTEYKRSNAFTPLICDRTDNNTWSNHTDQDLCGKQAGEDKNPNRISTRSGGYCLTTTDDEAHMLSIIDDINKATTLNAGEKVILPSGLSFVATNDGLYFGGGALEGAVNAENVYLPIYTG